MALDLAEHRRHREAGEGHVAAEIEAGDRLDQAKARDLEEVIERLVVMRVALSEPAREGQEALDERVAIQRVAPVEVAREQRPVRLDAAAASVRWLAYRRAWSIRDTRLSESTGRRRAPQDRCARTSRGWMLGFDYPVLSRPLRESR